MYVWAGPIVMCMCVCVCVRACVRVCRDGCGRIVMCVGRWVGVGMYLIVS